VQAVSDDLEPLDQILDAGDVPAQAGRELTDPSGRRFGGAGPGRDVTAAWMSVTSCTRSAICARRPSARSTASVRSPSTGKSVTFDSPCSTDSCCWTDGFDSAVSCSGLTGAAIVGSEVPSSRSGRDGPGRGARP